MSFESEVVKVEAVQKIYADYALHTGKCKLPRSGFYLVGIHGESDETAPCRPDTVGEHTDGLSHLVGAVALWAPELFPPDAELRASWVARYHDAPEIWGGDLPDDGNRNEAQKDASELQTMTRIIADWPETRRQVFLMDYEDFQQRRTLFGQTLYCLDKAEAVLRLLEYERRGVVGDIMAKPRRSRQDDENRAVCGSNNPADVWAVHCVMNTARFAAGDLVYELLVTAFTDVRGEVPEWLPRLRAEVKT